MLLSMWNYWRHNIEYFRVTPLLGYQPQDLLNKSVYDFYHPEDQALMKDSFDQGI